MKKILLLVLIAVLALSLCLTACEQECDHNYVEGVCTICGEKNPNYNPKPNTPTDDKLSTDVPAKASEPTLVLHYKRNDADYKSWGYWIWLKGGEGVLYKMNYIDDYGGIALYALSTFKATVNDTIGIIPRKLDSWTKDGDADRMLDLSSCAVDENNYIHIYLIEGDVELYKNMDDRKYNVSAKFTSESQIDVTAQMEVKTLTILAGETVFDTVDGQSQKRISYTIPADKTVLLTEPYTVKVEYASDEKVVTASVDISVLYSTDLFNNAFYYDGELGAIYSATETVFRVWSPVSTKIVLNIYNTGDQAEEPATHEMIKGEKGVFECYLSDKDYAGKYYTYTVYNSANPTGAEIVDPYARSAGLNGVRGQIVDFSKTNPEGWDSVTPFAYDRKELVVWETHVADVTSSKTWTGTEANRKKFLGLVESGTTYTKNNVTVKTGFDHIVELGVNAVQLVPIFDQANDEKNVKFNWGYNPLNYNVLEGCYSSDPTDGYVRINEFKQVVQAFNGAGINIIMDVVYNHVSSANGSNFDVLMPGYYFRYNSSGALTNGSGCGNDTASEHLMFRKFMIDSVCFWAKEYKLGGFRFDLMGLHDLETMNLLVAELKTINPNIVVYGEPWNLSTGLSSNKLAIQSNGDKYVGYGQFNDQMRDALIKGGMKGESERGWITNTSSVVTADLNCVLDGLVGKTNAVITDPDKTVNYVTCHDNYTLYDRIKKAGIADNTKAKHMAMLANSIVLTSSGTSFMLAGEEFLRTKNGDHNSYESSYEVNELNYELKITHADMFENYKALINFKKTCSGLHLTEAQIAGNYTVEALNGGTVIKIVIVDSASGRTYTVVHANGATKEFSMDLSGLTLYLDTLHTENLQLTANTAISAYQTIIAYK